MFRLGWWKLYTTVNSSYFRKIALYIRLLVSRNWNDNCDIRELQLEVRLELESREAYNINVYQGVKSNIQYQREQLVTTFNFFWGEDR